MDTYSVFFAERQLWRDSQARMLVGPCPMREQCLQYAVDEELTRRLGAVDTPAATHDPAEGSGARATRGLTQR